ncbi:MAG TPA: lysine biosynthesis protein LysW [Candidatus Dormibacteraeota bacterium]|nr:lysine biosynthesis protein LysW [Candidatus Dormibacteraeota bacterium]
MNSDPSDDTAACPECAGRLPVPAGTVSGEILACGACLAELEVVQLDPTRLALAPEVEEDWGE